MFSGSDLVQSHRVNLITIALSNVSITLQLPCVKTSNTITITLTLVIDYKFELQILFSRIR